MVTVLPNTTAMVMWQAGPMHEGHRTQHLEYALSERPLGNARLLHHGAQEFSAPQRVPPLEPAGGGAVWCAWRSSLRVGEETDPGRQQDWFLKRLQGRRVLPLAAFGVATLYYLETETQNLSSTTRRERALSSTGGAGRGPVLHVDKAADTLWLFYSKSRGACGAKPAMMDDPPGGDIFSVTLHLGSRVWSAPRLVHSQVRACWRKIDEKESLGALGELWRLLGSGAGSALSGILSNTSGRDAPFSLVSGGRRRTRAAACPR
jgi:hypothetical protein